MERTIEKARDQLGVAAGRYLASRGRALDDDLIFGDDGSVAVVVLLDLVAMGWLISNALTAWWLVPLLAIAMTRIPLQRARRACESGAPGLTRDRAAV